MSKVPSWKYFGCSSTGPHAHCKPAQKGRSTDESYPHGGCKTTWWQECKTPSARTHPNFCTSCHTDCGHVFVATTWKPNVATPTGFCMNQNGFSYTKSNKKVWWELCFEAGPPSFERASGKFLAGPESPAYRCTRLGQPFSRMKLPRTGKDAMTDTKLIGHGPGKQTYDEGFSTVHCNFAKVTECSGGHCSVQRAVRCVKVCKMKWWAPTEICSESACRPSYCKILASYQ